MKDLANVVGGPLLRQPWGAAFSAGVGVSWPASSFHCRLSRGIFTLFARNLSLRISKASMTLKATLFLALLPTPQKEWRGWGSFCSCHLPYHRRWSSILDLWYRSFSYTRF